MGKFALNSKWPPMYSKLVVKSQVVGQRIVYLDMCNLKPNEMVIIRKLMMYTSCI